MALERTKLEGKPSLARRSGIAVRVQFRGMIPPTTGALALPAAREDRSYLRSTDLVSATTLKV